MYLFNQLLLSSLYLPQFELANLVKLVDVLALCTLFLWLNHFFIFKVDGLLFKRAFQVYGGLLLCLILTLPFNFSNILILARWTCLLVIPYTLVFLNPVRYQRFINFLCSALPIYFVIAMIIAFLQRYWGFFHFTDGVFDIGQLNRSSALMGNSAQFGVSTLMLFIVFRFIAERRSKLVTLSAFSVFACLILSGTRTAIGFFLIYFFLQKIKISVRSVSILFFILLLTILIPEVSSSIFSSAFTQLKTFLLSKYNGVEIFSFEQGGYCFDIDGNPYFDKSLGLRLEKALFVLKNTFQGWHFFGIGFGACIGNSADSLFFRLLNDGGLVLVLGFCFLLASMLKYTAIQGFRESFIIFLGCSLFFDTLYFQSMCLCWGLLISSAEFKILKQNLDKEKCSKD